ncbi:hypothetical protein GCK72_016491 [Caenorhabditis remanei]|uniref:RING-type domain-containing protein n=1 Tax=Caenorhabditis remanei TaxID=31234 RepID=A0A6A5G4U6_CAERE|nr:hypothetical protein GCK72_016491 [Caenorhabditis remanei]KAF1749946.1 hypothetical protein GCK72_016491 [Caenorhabditis remanei]
MVSTTQYSFHDKITWLIGILNFLVTIVAIISSSAFENPKKLGIPICEFVFSLMCATTMLEFVRVARGFIKLRRPSDDEMFEMETLNPLMVQLEEANVQEELVAKKPYCEMCMEEYRYPPGPKVMAICGHTVCEYCADKYLSDSSNELNTCCPLGLKTEQDNAIEPASAPELSASGPAPEPSAIESALESAPESAPDISTPGIDPEPSANGIAKEPAPSSTHFLKVFSSLVQKGKLWFPETSFKNLRSPNFGLW